MSSWKHVSHFVVGCLSMIFAGPLGTAMAAKPAGSITGLVVDASTDQPIAGAYVGTGDFGDSGGSNMGRFAAQGLYAHTQTDGDGRFEISGIMPHEHPLVVTHPNFVRHDQTVTAAEPAARPSLRISLTPAAKLRVTVVDAEGTHLSWPYFRIRLEALDGHKMLPPDRNPHLSSFASPVWTARADQGVFTFTELAAGEYTIDVLNVRSVQMSYHGQLSRVRVNLGQTQEVQVPRTEFETSVTLEIPALGDTFAKLGHSHLVISRNPGLVVWADGRVRSLEDPRLGRIVQTALIASPVSAVAEYRVQNLPPGTYSFLAGPAVCLQATTAQVVAGTEIAPDLRWPVPEPSQAGKVGLARFDRRIQLQQEEYLATEICERLTIATESQPEFLVDRSLREQSVRCPVGEITIWELLEHIHLLTQWQLLEQGENSLILSPAAKPPPNGSLSGRVEGADGQPVAGACVWLCAQDGGMPISERLDQTLVQAFQTRAQPTAAFATSDAAGQFAFESLQPGEYRLVAQSWKDAEPIQGLLEVNGPEITLHGVAEHISVTPETPSAVVIRPLGTGTLRLDESLPNDETLLVISTHRPRADPILGFVGWTGPFLEHAIGANRMPHGKTLIHGLPEGLIHVVAFAADSAPGFGAAEVQIRSQTTSVTRLPLVASWSDGHHDPPPRLVSLCDEIKSLTKDTNTSVNAWLESHGIRPPQGNPLRVTEQIAEMLAKPITLPSGRKTTYADVMAAARYVELRRLVERRAR